MDMEMETIRLDGAGLCRREEAMALLGEALALPEWWGRNLDALYDCLTGELGRPVQLELSGREAMEATDFGRLLLRVLEDAAEACAYFDVTFSPEKTVLTDVTKKSASFSQEKRS